ncbi:response regulator transcription factor [Micromonospora sp. NPDC000207]|uniref:helix-turn-helix transcriptional regulator n=1 Tax=Micromonospora sp. NPDC000207 TaxID=3154246 RepID=UPI003324524E
MILQKGLEAILRDLPAVARVHTVDTAAAAAAQLRQRCWDLLVVPADVGAPVERMLSLARGLDVKTLAVLLATAGPLLEAAVELPADGFVVAVDVDHRVLAEALHDIQRGEMPVPKELGRFALSALQGRHRIEPETRLTPREQEALELLARGLSNRQIASALGISEHGAKRHVCRILTKLDCPNRTTAVATAYRLGLVEEPVG